MPGEHLKEFMAQAPVRDAAGSSALPAPSLPQARDDYRPWGRPLTEPVYSLHLILGAAGCVSFQYVHLDSHSSLTTDRKGQVIALRFGGLKPASVVIRGRNLRMLYDYIHQHKIPWIEQLDAGRDFSEGDEAVVISIDVTEIQDEEQRPAYGPAKVLEMADR